MNTKSLTEEMVVYHDDDTGLDYVSFDGKTLVPLNATADFEKEIQTSNRQKFDDSALEKEYENRKDKVTQDSEEHYQKRVDAIKKSKNKQTSAELDRETKKHTEKTWLEKPRIKAKGGDTKFYSNYKPNRGNLNKFKVDLQRAIGSQIYEFSEDTYSEFNPNYSDSDLIMPGQKNVEKNQKPSLYVYYDYSGSWGMNDIKLGNSAIACLNSFKQAGLVDIELFYFSNEVTTTPPPQGGTNGNAVLEHIKQHNPYNVVIMTDDDYSSGYDSFRGKIGLEGSVFFLWKHGKQGTAFIDHLSGKRGTFGYDFD